ncbi:phospholipid:diacylglycerol acyltransferase [Strigomonas culicis]|uniref:Phospholipid:diacylglycerol acyltransferase n=1 Tax=Strigomonas culicis TaxID=28005 RepID=S9TTT3_9TRYP|nr:phospholipid:diacylglycerol acyltransferase [Strigomonas culicis]|eukprot:EPY19969.1 phospholipid:diacylglycerol acyltransferase [Strigomonas culicis]
MPPAAGADRAAAEGGEQAKKWRRFAEGAATQLPHKHPVIIIPGFITGGLELWEARNIPCLQEKYFAGGNNFRQRMFGPQMLFLMLTDAQCWLDLFSLDKRTGRDPANVKVRADSGFASVDYFLPGYWVWAKVLINLADIGYDPQSVAVMTYDWRLSPATTHERDGFFYNMRSNIKFFCQKNRHRSVVISHSYGTTVALAFFRWIGAREPQFLNRFVGYWINVGGVTLGLPKAMAAMLLGDVKDTMSIPAPARRAIDSFLSQSARSEFTRTYSCLAAMMPRGCEEPYAHLLQLPNGTSVGRRDTFRLMRAACARSGHENCVRQMDALEPEMDELPSLPQAPDMTVVCLYGVNKAVEVGYHVMPNPGADDVAEWTNNASYSPSYVNERADAAGGGTATLDTFNHSVFQGVRQANGDGTVPLASLAYMCRAPNGWRQNVGRVVTMEYNHEEDSSGLNLRDGDSSGDHVNVLGNFELLETILKIASGVDYASYQELQQKRAAGVAVDEATDDQFESVDPQTGERQVLHRRVHDRIYSDIDRDIQTRMQECLKKVSKPIVPKTSAIDDNEFL